MNLLLYFGCLFRPGHYLFLSENGTTIQNASSLERFCGIRGQVTDRFIQCIDGLFTPVRTGQGIYKISHVPPFLIVAWHDYTVDKRPGSNSALLGVGFTHAEEMFAAARLKFPSVMARQMQLSWMNDIAG